ncbi:MAG: formylglycine-generating enzyme family protein, partial [Candidatus Riflebacteria bacterium]|nr:formylglycine-generating enzyme family protein [Candidatus Riflebacteria bacterium]
KDEYIDKKSDLISSDESKSISKAVALPKKAIETNNDRMSESSDNSKIIELDNSKVLEVSETEKLWNDFRSNLVKCSANSFIMGSPLKEHLDAIEYFKGFNHNDAFRFEYNEVQHEVTFTKDFFIGKYPVTQMLYEKIMKNNPCEANYKNPNFPIVDITWEESIAFCNQLNILFKDYLPKGYLFDLPTEAQWEYACRAGTTTPLNNGQELTSNDDLCENLDEIAWYDKNNNDELHSVGFKKPNRWQIYEMSGLVSEWCKDYYGKYPKNSVEDYICKEESKYRVIRGSLVGMAFSCRSASRSFWPKDDKDNTIGFRVALVPI